MSGSPSLDVGERRDRKRPTRWRRPAPTTGEDSSTELSANARAELKGVVKKVADLGVGAAGKYTSAHYQGVLQQDLKAALQNSDKCRYDVFNALKDKIVLAAVPKQPKG